LIAFQILVIVRLLAAVDGETAMAPKASANATPRAMTARVLRHREGFLSMNHSYRGFPRTLIPTT
jgi:hypothetical protein